MSEQVPFSRNETTENVKPTDRDGNGAMISPAVSMFGTSPDFRRFLKQLGISRGGNGAEGTAGAEEAHLSGWIHPSRSASAEVSELEFASSSASASTESPCFSIPPADLIINDAVLRQYTEEYLGRVWIERETDLRGYLENYIRCYVDLGFDYIPLPFWIQFTLKGLPEPEAWISHGTMGLIRNWKEYAEFPWEDLEFDLESLETAESMLPEGMKIMVLGGDFQELLDVVIGTENFFFMMYDEPELLDAIIEQWFSLREKLYRKVVKYESTGGIWHCADLGSKNSTLVDPAFIRSHLLPFWKSYGKAVHEEGKVYFFHSCGNIYRSGIIDDLIDAADIDAFHSFQDVILPVTDFCRRYSGGTAVIGGIDVDVLTRWEEEDLRRYMRDIFAVCGGSRRYAAGTGNSITDYVPVERLLMLLEEAFSWQGA